LALNSGVWRLRLLGMGDTSAVRLLAPPVLNLSSCPIFRVHFRILGTPVRTFNVEYWLEWRNWLDVLAPLTVGGLVCGAVCSVLGYLAVQAVWRWNLVRRVRSRRTRYRTATSGFSTPSSKRQT